MVGLADDALRRKPAVPAGPALIEPLHEALHAEASHAEVLHNDRRQHPENPAQKIRHPRNVRILPRSRDFH